MSTSSTSLPIPGFDNLSARSGGCSSAKRSTISASRRNYPLRRSLAGPGMPVVQWEAKVRASCA